MGRRPLLQAIGLTMISVLPNFLLGALAPDMRVDLRFSAAALGALVTIANLVAGATSVPMGRFVQRVGVRISGGASMAVVGVALIGVAFARTWWHVAVLLAATGLAAATAQPAANLVLAREITIGRQGFAFGIKQSAVPAASFIAGAAVPVASLWLGWRWTWGLLGALTLVFAALSRAFLPDAAPPGERASGVLARSRVPSLTMLGVAAVFAGGAVVSMSTFLVETAVAIGVELADAGVLLAVSSASAVVMRIVQGWRADRRGSRHLITVARLILLGAAGFVIIGVATSTWVLVVGAVLGSSVGWGWNGVLHYSVVHYHRDAPAAASSFTQAGLFIGGSGGPLAFGLLVTHASYRVAWLAAAGAMLVSGVLMLVGRGVLRAAMAAEGASPAGAAHGAVRGGVRGGRS